MAKRVGIIGYPIRHSISPVFQQAALDYCSLDATYQAWEVAPHALAEFVQGIRSTDTLGINVTVPHKESVMSHLDYIDDWAQMAGAVNTIVNDGGNLAGHNTDGFGFLKALEEHGHFSPEGTRVLIIGAGGSAKAVAVALARKGVSTITIANRTLQRAQRLAELIEGRGSRVEVIALFHPGEDSSVPSERALARAAATADLLVNCTTLGMKHGPGEHTSPIPFQHIPSRALVYDLVYNPPDTPLLREAARAGAATLGGLPMLVFQGAASFELWTAKKAPVEVMMKAAEAALA